jgi:hypothetical protein
MIARIPLKAVVYRSEHEKDKYVAQCLELNLVGASRIRKSAIEELIGAMQYHFETFRRSHPFILFSDRTPQEYWNMLQKALLDGTIPSIRRIDEDVSLYVYDCSGKSGKSGGKHEHR